MDFTLKTHTKLLNALESQGFLFQPFAQFNGDEAEKIITLRQDVDLLPQNSLEFARIHAGMGIRSTFYFRSISDSFDPNIIEEIAGMGHEIGYHYEDLSFAWAKLKASGVRHQASGEEFERELVDIAIESFSRNLEKFRKIVPVKTICMHGSPMSRWDSRLLWKYYDYHDFGIIGEPYFDVDFAQVLYLTDTGRRWDGEAVSIRDKASGVSTYAKASADKGRQVSGENPYKDWKVKPFKFRETFSLSPPLPLPPSHFKFHSTFDIIKAANEDRLPNQIMMTFHPQRWTDKPVPWVRELVWQNVKNIGKFFIVRSMK